MLIEERQQSLAEVSTCGGCKINLSEHEAGGTLRPSGLQPIYLYVGWCA